MGRSAKVHKRLPKKLKPPTSSSTTAPHVAGASASAPPLSRAQNAKRKADLKAKVSKGKNPGKSESGVLGGADYVSLLMGGRRRAREEAEKLPQDEDP